MFLDFLSWCKLPLKSYNNINLRKHEVKRKGANNTMKMKKINSNEHGSYDGCNNDSVQYRLWQTDGGKVYYLNFKPEAGRSMAESGKSLHRRNRNRGNSCNSSIRTV